MTGAATELRAMMQSKRREVAAATRMMPARARSTCLRIPAPFHLADKDIRNTMSAREQLHRDGYALLRQAIPMAWLAELRAAFDAGVRPSDQWPVPRGAGWRYALLDEEPMIQAVCRLPQVLAVVGELIGERFFLAQVEGREPLAGAGHQRLHRDLSEQRPGDIAHVMAYFDDYGPENGATRIVPASHRPKPDEPPFDLDDESNTVQLCGSAGDILVFDVDLVHAGSLNRLGTRRRSILISYCAETLYVSYLPTRSLRGIRMDASERFEPDDFAWGSADRTAGACLGSAEA